MTLLTAYLLVTTLILTITMVGWMILDKASKLTNAQAFVVATLAVTGWYLLINQL